MKSVEEVPRMSSGFLACTPDEPFSEWGALGNAFETLRRESGG